MEEWKQTVAANLAALRKSHHLTQLQLAEMLHYSDKAVSKWERGESLPDLAVLKQLADLYEITLDDFLLTEDARRAKQQSDAPSQAAQDAPAAEETDALPPRKRHNHLIIAGMAMILVWLIASLIFVVLDAALPELEYGPFLFIYAAPVTAIVCLVFNSVWFNPRWNFLIISVLVWTVLLAIFLTLIEYRIWKIFLIGIPAQIIIFLWSRLKPAAK